MSYIDQLIEKLDVRAKEINKDRKSQNVFLLCVAIIYCIITGFLFTAICFSVLIQERIVGAIIFMGIPFAASVIFSFIFYPGEEKEQSEEITPGE